MLNVLGKCDVLGEAMQPFVHHQHDGVVKIKYREELRSRYAKFVYCNHNREGGKGGVMIPFHAQILTKFTSHVRF